MANVALRPEQDNEAWLLYGDHEWPVSDIADLFGVSENAVKSAIVRAGGTLAPRTPAPVKVKQCTRCLHFLPNSAFWMRGDGRLESWCNDCKNQRHERPFNVNPAPLAQALSQWRTQ